MERDAFRRLRAGVSAGALTALASLATATATPASAAPDPAGGAAPRPRKVIVEPPPPLPDPAAREQAEEANLVGNGPRHGWAFAFTGVGWQQVASFDDSERGAGSALRLGNSATPTTVLWLELLVAGFPGSSRTDCMTSGNTPRCRSRIESSASLTATAQTYLGTTVWLRGGAGLASYTQVVVAPTVDREESRTAQLGLAAVTGLGVDVVRWHSTRLALEGQFSLHRFAAGWITNLGIGVGLTYY
jgi:hypothetical protein